MSVHRVCTDVRHVVHCSILGAGAAQDIQVRGGHCLFCMCGTLVVRQALPYRNVHGRSTARGYSSRLLL